MTGWSGRQAVALRRRLAQRKRLVLRERLVLRKRLAGWLRRWSERAARAASALDRPGPVSVSEVQDGPPEHWLRLVAERAPELLEGRGIRVGMPSPRAAGKMPPMPDVSRPSPEPPARPVLRRAEGPAGHRSRQGGQDSDGVVDSWPQDRHRAPAEDRSHSTAGSIPARTAVPSASPGADLRRAGWGTPQKWLTRLMPWRIVRARPRDEPRPPVPSSSAAPPRGQRAVEARSVGTPMVDAAVWTAPAPVPAGRDEPPPRHWDDPPAPDHGTADAWWPRPPSGGPWPWATGTAGTAGTAGIAGSAGDRWPALPDDGLLWTLPATAFTDDRVRRLDAEQRGV